MKPLMPLMVFVLLAVAAFGIPQEPDKMILDGEEVKLFETPLEWLWLGKTVTPLLYAPDDSPGAKRRPRVGGGYVARGYVATWSLNDNRLMLEKLEETVFAGEEGDGHGKLATYRWEACEIPIETLFPGKKAPVFAEWFSGTVQASSGEEIPRPPGFMCSHMARLLRPVSRLEHDSFMEFKAGVLVSRTDISNQGENLYRTERNQPWKTYGDRGGTARGWVDARQVAVWGVANSGKSFKTRGVFSRRLNDNSGVVDGMNDAVAVLKVCETPDWRGGTLAIYALPPGDLPPEGALVETTCRIRYKDDKTKLAVTKIRKLQADEALFRKNYILEWAQLNPCSLSFSVAKPRRHGPHR